MKNQAKRKRKEKKKGKKSRTLARALVLNVDGGLEVAHHGPELALVSVGDVIRATDRGVHLRAHLGALGAVHAGKLRAGGGEALLGLGQAD